ncbi:tyrosyl-tRNA synthetase [Lentisphaera araneosa HTCC2155]|uniref:Tyrosine--tRNA ligase n=1 Tax=Lentisphaera araneosa HTCC2155 TaxID=313628 RepID=A6DIN7_9BACT|nr:tyrosine--tRNA ligase [Lentisphaera araneosa]EDM28323.1 tyrosyl-tRNA synthetase [Lentisphaera araneosa HTCC2155]
MADNIYDELKWRGLIFQESGQDELRSYLSDEKISVYCGFDPTADSLHIGHLVPLITLRRFQEYGHSVLPLAGGATGMIGDPSGKSQERNLLSSDDIAHNVESIKSQLKQIIDFSGDSATLVNNFDWISKINIIEYLRDIGKNFSVNVMMNRDSVSSRLEGKEAGLSYTEFSYMVLQGYDFLHLNREHNCTLQIGGSDQWGNMTSGMDLIRRSNGKRSFCMTVPLIMKSDGTKFGKTAGGSVWLDPKQTCPYDFYQYWFNVADADVIRFIKFFTFLPQDVVEALQASVEQEPHLREAQKKLAWEMTTMIHGEEEAKKAIFAAAALFGREDIREVDAITMDALHNATEAPSFSSLDEVEGILSLLTASGLCKSSGEARKMVQGNGISLNNEKVKDFRYKPVQEDLIHQTYLVLRKGKKDFSVIKFT